MKKRFRKLTIAQKTWILLLVFVLIPLLVLGSVVFYGIFSRVRETEYHAIAQRLVNISDNIAEELNKVSSVAKKLNTDSYINELAKGGKTPQRYVQSKRLVEEALQNNETIVKAQVISDDEVAWQYGPRNGFAFNNKGNETFIKKIEEGDELAFWSPAHQMLRLKQGKYEDPVTIVSFYSSIYDPVHFHKNGVLALHMEEKTVRNLYQNFLYGESQGAWLVGADGALLSSSQADWLEKGIPDELKFSPDENSAGIHTVVYHGEKSEIFWQKCSNMNVYLVQMINQVSGVEQYLGIILLALLIFGALFIGYMSTYQSLIARPLQNLAEKMERAKNLELDQEAEVVSGDEIGMLTLAFQNMLRNMDELIDKIYIEKIKTQEAEQEAMLSQINPHFLYNTLDSIRWNALSHGEREVAGQLEALSTMLRNTLNFGQKNTTIEQEMRIIESYCFLLQARFRHEIKVNIQVEPEVMGCRIPKLLIQPLVENAYKHGLENQMGEKRIDIRIRKRKDKMVILVADNGVGCESRKIMEYLHKAEGKECFALRNIKERLQLAYGERASFCLYSVPAKGTISRLVIPCE